MPHTQQQHKTTDGDQNCLNFDIIKKGQRTILQTLDVNMKIISEIKFNFVGRISFSLPSLACLTWHLIFPLSPSSGRKMSKLCYDKSNKWTWNFIIDLVIFYVTVCGRSERRWKIYYLSKDALCMHGGCFAGFRGFVISFLIFLFDAKFIS